VFCPKCKDEFRPGFTRCGRCNVDLVEGLSAKASGSRESAEMLPPLVRLGDYCGFLSLDDARHARDQLRERQIRSEIVLRESPSASSTDPIREEWWLRVDVSRVREVASILGGMPEVEDHAAEGDSGFACGDCGERVASEEVFCPKCGARFDD
jgi:hypothetical protein